MDAQTQHQENMDMLKALHKEMREIKVLMHKLVQNA